MTRILSASIYEYQPGNYKSVPILDSIRKGSYDIENHQSGNFKDISAIKHQLISTSEVSEQIILCR